MIIGDYQKNKQRTQQLYNKNKDTGLFELFKNKLNLCGGE
jgi:hypothetical protein